MPESLKAESLSNYTSSAKLPSDYYEFSLSIKYEDDIEVSVYGPESLQ